MKEFPVVFKCHSDHLYGVIHSPCVAATRGVLIVVGGPQTRVGSHRQFVLLARDLARQGIPVMRFDYRGMGDSEGEALSFKLIQDDIQTAITVMFRQLPELKEVVLWGLCDAATAIAKYGDKDDRVIGLALLNPWVESERGESQAYVKTYYARRFIDPGFWKKIAKGDVHLVASGRSFLSHLRMSLFGHKTKTVPEFVSSAEKSLSDEMLAGLSAFRGNLLFILSGNDITAQEFVSETAASKQWSALFKTPRVKRHELPAANHTFSSREWRDRVSVITQEWLESLP